MKALGANYTIHLTQREVDLIMDALYSARGQMVSIAAQCLEQNQPLLRENAFRDYAEYHQLIADFRHEINLKE
jgi:hypothetical protein